MKLKASILQGLYIGISVTTLSVSCNNDSKQTKNNKASIQLQTDSNQQWINIADTNAVPNVEFDACPDCGRG